MLNSYLLRALSGGDESMSGPFGNKIPKAYMSPDQLKTMNEESSKLTNSKLDPSKMVTGAGAVSNHPPAGSNIPPMPQGIPGISVGQNEDKSLAAFLAGLA